MGADKPGWSRSEKIIGDNLDHTIKHAKGRIIMAVFASNVGRIIQAVHSAVRYNRIVYLAGRSMINNVEICRELGYINVPKDYLRKIDNGFDGVPDDRVMFLCTGAQGEEFAALARISRGEHQQIKLRK